MNTASGMMEFEGQNNDFGGTKRYNNIPSDQRLKGFGPPKNSFGPPTMVGVVVDFKDRAPSPLIESLPNQLDWVRIPLPRVGKIGQIYII